jgi:hypothetical protein
MWDLHHREWLLSSLEARAAPSRQHSNLYLSAGLSVYINCDSEIQTSFSMHAVPGHKKSYFHYSPKINSNLESAGRWPSSPRFEHFCYKIECSKVTQHTRLLGNISGDFGIFSGALAVCKSLSLRAFSSVCPMYALPWCCVCLLCVPLFTWSERWVRVCHLALCMMCVCGAGTKHSRRKRKKTLGCAGCLHRTNTRSQTQLLRLNVFNRTVDVQRGGAALCLLFHFYILCAGERRAPGCAFNKLSQSRVTRFGNFFSAIDARGFFIRARRDRVFNSSRSHYGSDGQQSYGGKAGFFFLKKTNEIYVVEIRVWFV